MLGWLMLLAAIGLYGVMAYSVSQRTHEIGIRMALGAQAGDVLRMMLGQSVLLVLLGLSIGLAGAFATLRVIETMLFGVTATDPTTFVGTALLLTSVAMLACYLPSRRATKIDSMVVLRSE